MILEILLGPPAGSSKRAAILEERLRQAGGTRIPVVSVEARWTYFVGAKALTPKTLSRTATLLEAEGPRRPTDGFFVTPRKGTVSPWSSKATDILHNCGLHEIARVERGVHWRLLAPGGRSWRAEEVRPLWPLLHDRMIEGVYDDVSDLFAERPSPPSQTIPLLEDGPDALHRANRALGLALSESEIAYLFEAYHAMGRNPTDVELVMFGQVNSEHCRHKIFNADWGVDGVPQPHSLMAMIRHTHSAHPAGTRVAYRDNAAVLEGGEQDWFLVPPRGRRLYQYIRDHVDRIMKVETHNHPTAIAPYPGAATGSGGEIRDEGATGRGGKTRVGLCGFAVSHLRLPEFPQPWETVYAQFPNRLATPLQIMIEGPIGAARYGNEFGRPQIAGFFRTFEQRCLGRYRGYHKPIMIAGGMGHIRRCHAEKASLPAGAPICQIGGPALRIGLGGGAASSMGTGENTAELDFDSVQRDNAEMERRCQEVIDACIALGDQNPILSIHDLGAGGLSNGCPELVAECGGEFWLRKVPNEDPSMSPMEIWCCEAQERYVLALRPEGLELFAEICRRERCPMAVIGRTTGDGRLVLHDETFGNRPIDMDLRILLRRPPRLRRNVHRRSEIHPPLQLESVSVEEAVHRVLRMPAVAAKTFLITIADRSVGGMVARDQMIGPWQMPVADVAVTAASFQTYEGEAMAIGERTPLALVSAPASGRMAVGEALTNLAAAWIGSLSTVKLSANWMCACGEDGEDAALYDTVRAVALELCPRLGVSIPVGKDSLSMRAAWTTSDGHPEKIVAPLSLIVSAFAPVRDVRRTLTPDLKPGESVLVLLDLGGGRNRLGGGALAQAWEQMGSPVPDVDDPSLLVRFFAAVQELVEREWLLAYHDRSDGGLFVTVAEMAMAGRRGVELILDAIDPDDRAALFAEELGAVLQVPADRMERVTERLAAHGLAAVTHTIGRVTDDLHLTVRRGGRLVYRERIGELTRLWWELTYHMQARRDDPDCAREEWAYVADDQAPGLNFHLTYDPEDAPTISLRRPPLAILREQGVNGHVEMAAAFDRAGFECLDVHMTDLLSDQIRLDDVVGLVVCGGFSYGDVLGAGTGWARTILFHCGLKEQFERFFMRPDTFALGVCNGCQMLAQLKEIIPGADAWPRFTANRSEQFEARYVTVEVVPSPSVLLCGMEGSRIGIPVAHGEGRADFQRTGSPERVERERLLVLRYVDPWGQPTERYPFNPNGSPGGWTGFTTTDGRVTIMMPHPERAFRSVQLSYRPSKYCPGENGPWMRLFENARRFVG